jgi:hypothetical protein
LQNPNTSERGATPTQSRTEEKTQKRSDKGAGQPQSRPADSQFKPVSVQKEKKAKEIAEGFASKHKDAGNNSKPSKPKDAAGSKGVKTETIRTAKEPREQREQREWREAKQLMDGQHQNVSMWVTHELLLYIFQVETNYQQSISACSV